ncbi:methylated-DNA--[protein]-cysteine S-methyltransferase [Roseomonas sp. CECT 9278]|uniref:methylated-DNA--[protein]-cysteine S-methyltransferase n=1 Tax=Roseomonas sp. CECT 9278 TaxID=2845823 RepID=UPI001E65B923|nr:methylated-DNA--[protein]-cysteine S-methyltransferase [Roseomonas sp. CECT 9278]CAH0144180.1 Methylated-DNA--protein-cysteine methyltransferase, constitutive [Roseomonas sp. CECT 9278]
MPQLSLHTPLGDLTVSEEDGAIVALDWGRGRDQDATPLLLRARDQLQDYFDGIRTGFDLPLAPHGTAFRRKVWDALRTIPAGQTRSYLDIARQVGCRAPRAIGQANGANPIPILIPCHRVVAADGTLGGYSGGEGAATKRYLLDLERVAPAADTLFTAATTPAQRRTRPS